MQYNVKLIVSPFPNSPLLSILFGVKGNKAKGVLDIDLEARTLRVQGATIWTKTKQYAVTFDEIKEIESKAMYFLTIRLKNGEEIRLRGLDELPDVLGALSEYVSDVTQPRIQQQIERFAKRRRK